MLEACQKSKNELETSQAKLKRSTAELKKSMENDPAKLPKAIDLWKEVKLCSARVTETETETEELKAHLTMAQEHN